MIKTDNYQGLLYFHTQNNIMVPPPEAHAFEYVLKNKQNISISSDY